MTAPSRTPEIAIGPGREKPLGPEAWGAWLSAELDTRVEVVFTRARRTVLKVVPRGAQRTVRMNAFFADAPPDVRMAVVSWIRAGRRAHRKLEILDAWVEAQIELLERSAPRPSKSAGAGRVHDIERLARELIEGEFRGEFAPDGAASRPQLSWGRAPRSARTRTRRTLRLGSFDYWTGLVRMHPVLDQPAVPESFVRYVLFHELLHAALPAERGTRGRRVFHSREFRRREQLYSGTKAALAWEAAHLQELLWSARTGQDMRPAKVLAHGLAARDRGPGEVADKKSKPIAARGGLRRLVQRWLFD